MEAKVLKAIFSSGTRIKLLSLFFLNPGTSYYARQLEKVLKTPVGQLRYELVNMEKAGLMLTAMQGNQKQYRINTEFGIYEELKSIFLKTVSIGDVIREKIADLPGIELAFVFGSFAANEAHANSDIDIMVVGSPDEKKLHRAVVAAENRLNRRVNYSLYGRKETQKRLASGDNFIRTVFTGPIILLKGNSKDELFGTGKQQLGKLTEKKAIKVTGGRSPGSFFGTGTTGAVAAKPDRKWIGIEENKVFVKLAEKRLKKNKGE